MTTMRIELTAPMSISSHLTPCVRLEDGSTLYVQHYGQVTHRLEFWWLVEDANGRVLEAGADLSVAVWSDLSDATREAMSALISFLSACAESRAYGPDAENRDLFNEAVGQWAEDHSDELDLLGYEMEDEAA